MIAVVAVMVGALAMFGALQLIDKDGTSIVVTGRSQAPSLTTDGYVRSCVQYTVDGAPSERCIDLPYGDETDCHRFARVGDPLPESCR